jgi:hypothetical protein
MSFTNHAEEAETLGLKLLEGVKTEYPGGWAKHPTTWREYFQTYLVYVPVGEPFEIFLDAGDATIADNSDERRLGILMEKVAARLAER